MAVTVFARADSFLSVEEESRQDEPVSTHRIVRVASGLGFSSADWLCPSRKSEDPVADPGCLSQLVFCIHWTLEEVGSSASESEGKQAERTSFLLP